LVYDLPLRFFHWFFVVLFLTAFIIGKNVEDDTLLFSYHMIAGMVLLFVVLLRIIWGFLGSRHSRFSDFSFNPLELIKYLISVTTGSKKVWPGHNPASSWAGLVMMILVLGLGVTGLLMTSGGDKEAFEDLHEIFGNLLFITAVLHILGVIVHTVRYSEFTGLSMVHGKKVGVGLEQSISSSRPIIGLSFLALVFAFSYTLVNNFDVHTKELKIMGKTLQLGESEKSEGLLEHDQTDFNEVNDETEEE
jgi:cytochrome b